MATTWIDSGNMLLALKEQMNAEMMKAAEPVIRKAAEDAEKEMRKRLGAMFIAMIDKDFCMDRHDTDLRILIKYANGV